METNIIGWVVNSILLAIAIFLIRFMLSGVRKDIEAIKQYINTCVEKLDKEDNDLWKALNTHGHKGLNGEQSKVTR